MKTALTSPEMAAASSDVPNFATGGATLYSAEATSSADGGARAISHVIRRTVTP